MSEPLPAPTTADPDGLEPPAARDPFERPGPPSDGPWAAGAERWERLTGRPPPSGARVVAAVVVLLGLAAGGWWLLRPPPPPIEATIPQAAPVTGAPPAAGEATAPPTSAAPTVVVHAAGAVQRPGVYRLPAGARVDDLIVSAGGLAPGADGDRINLAAPLGDGQRVYAPRLGEPTPPEPVTGAGDGPAGSPPAAPGVPSPPSAPVDLNTATAEQLDTLPGVGPSTAQAILDYRREHGRFRSVDELLEVRGIGEAKLADLRSKVRV